MKNAEVSSTSIGGSFSLINHDGEEVSDETYLGYFVLVFFGFTNCRVVCPRALAKLSAALDSLGALAERIRAIYITVDPERDTSAAMHAFLRPYPRFTGLTGSRDQIDHAKQAFRVFAERKDDPTGRDAYVIPHTAITYLMDTHGRFVAHFTDALSAEEMATRLRLLLGSTEATWQAGATGAQR